MLMVDRKFLFLLVGRFSSACCWQYPRFTNNFPVKLMSSSSNHIFRQHPILTMNHRNLETGSSPTAMETISYNNNITCTTCTDFQESKLYQQLEQTSKVHTVTVCVVPPPENYDVWKTLSEMRLELKDPGFYRWPPHINLLYPFIKLHHNENDASNTNNNEDCEEDGDDDDDKFTVSDVVEQLELATRKITPFSLRLKRIETFGGRRRGVLWLHPDCIDCDCTPQMFEGSDNNNEEDDDDSNNNRQKQKQNLGERSSPLIRLQQSLEEVFQTCRDQSQKGGSLSSSSFVPHMTLSHFASRAEALHAKEILENTKSNNPNNQNNLEFLLDRIYLLERGDGGQFLRVAEIALGGNSEDISKQISNNSSSSSMYIESEEDSSRIRRVETKIFDPPQKFPNMPDREDEWVYDERMQLKVRRKGNRNRSGGSGRQRRHKGRRTSSPRIADTPEIIAEKMAKRKAKRERLLRENK